MHTGEIRSIIVQFDDPETGLDQMAKHRYDQDIRKHEQQRGIPIFNPYNPTYENNEDSFYKRLKRKMLTEHLENTECDLALKQFLP